MQGNVEREVAVNQLSDPAQVERNDMLRGRMQAAMADRAFEAYNFGEGVVVVGVSDWEFYAAGHERSREVYVGIETRDSRKNTSTRLGLTVRFDPQTGALAKVYAQDALGSIFGCMPQEQLEKLNAEHQVRVSNPDEPLPRQARGAAAYEPTVEDVENVLRSNSLAVANAKGKSFDSMANEIHGDLDFDLVEQAALTGDDLDEQTDYANDEIARQLRERGILEPLKQACDSPSPGI
ncbi:hypothetical protein [Acidovorax sp. sic0104]|uniref:hypothetical protein n=1 Tax=Acidovorax sp. sic0104 TaxID=2854784 RepID=UPI001C4486E5|nr:hypothetical protein [Acidovorax sp. sic0104]MBV7542186.1 hypothetical protein [Acidovorax sp. sic0104]